ncbi:FkbM family methyltransferase [Brevundimonas vesicularis]|uniref:FkbM family methyltransferase n=1 Tax=Brevundimonas vesicularis TaxID=41276 RepID=UPI0022ABE63C|nr:FkbM family methyltransferase [Brevundimonas vesicularis]
MFMHEDFWLPDGEQHWLQANLADYQSAGRRAAYKYVKDWRRALDIGGNIGIFARAFSDYFGEVVSFEPVPGIRECLVRNVPKTVVVQPYALADQPGELIMHQLTKGSGGSFIANHPGIATPTNEMPVGRKAVPVEVRTIDSFEYDSVGLMKLDIQGAEYLALLGAQETITRCRPVIILEEKPRPGDDLDAQNAHKAAELLVSLGMTPKEKPGGDRIYIFE